MHKYWRVGDMVTWQEFDPEFDVMMIYVGTVRDLLSTQMVVHTTNGTQRFVFYKDHTLKAYKQGEPR